MRPQATTPSTPLRSPGWGLRKAKQVNPLTRRRWMKAKPWIRDAAIAVGFVAAIVTVMWLLDEISDLMNG